MACGRIFVYIRAFSHVAIRAQSLQNNTHSTTNSALKSTVVVEQVHTRS